MAHADRQADGQQRHQPDPDESRHHRRRGPHVAFGLILHHGAPGFGHDAAAGVAMTHCARLAGQQDVRDGSDRHTGEDHDDHEGDGGGEQPHQSIGSARAGQRRPADEVADPGRRRQGDDRQHEQHEAATREETEQPDADQRRPRDDQPDGGADRLAPTE